MRRRRFGDGRPRRPALGALAAAAAAAATGGRAGVRAAEVAASSPCTGLATALSIDKVHTCAEEVMSRSTTEQSRALKKSLGALSELRDACNAANENSSLWGCKAMSDLAYELFAEGVALQHTCQTGSAQECDERGQSAALGVLHAFHFTETRFENTPAESMVTKRLTSLRGELFSVLATDYRLGEGEAALPPAWNVTVRVVDKLRQWVSGYIWRETHWLWLMDSLQAGKVVQTTWGDADEWLKFGVHDAHAHAPLALAPPKYTFSEHLGMRWEIMVKLLHELRERRGGGMLQVVEIGVFAGHLSHFLLRDCDFIHLLGIDPYIGRDGTFPGNFSETLDSDVALYKAASVFEEHGNRAQLFPVTSEAAVPEIQDGSIDVVFVDGCHLYDCVKQDLDLWLPKMRRGLPTLVAGHDFSPQWPGVVQAVHERRSGGREVMLASDWMFWWFEQY